MNNKNRLIELLGGVSDIFPGEVSPEQLEMVADVLSPYEYNKVACAVREGLKTWEFFPTPAKIIKLMKPDTETASHWIEIICKRASTKGLNAGHGDLPEHVKKAMNCVGGYRAFCLTELDKLPFLKKDFIRAYDDFAQASEQSDFKGLSNTESKGLLNNLENRKK